MFTRVFFILAFVFILLFLACVYVKYYADDDFRSKFMANCGGASSLCRGLINLERNKPIN